jgi:predicted nucleic acid-binding protein
MILYLDASALVKRYIAEIGSEQVNHWIADADSVVTVIITRTEVAAAISRAERMKLISDHDAQNVLEVFRAEWEIYQRLPVTEVTVVRGDYLACRFGLRGYDAVHLAAAILWQETLGEPVTIASFDTQLREAAGKLGIAVLPFP